MDFLVQAIIPYVLLYKYSALFVITFLASLIVPIPAGTLLVASSAFASQGYFNMTTLIITVIIANIIGDNLSYWLARLYGRVILSKVAFFRKILASKNFILVERSIDRHTGPFIIISRFEVISNLTTNIICGMSKVSYKKFVTYEIIGTFANVSFYATLGYFFGDSWQAVNKLIGDFSIIFFLLIILGVSLFWKKITVRLSR